MAKTSQILRDLKRIKLIEKYAEKRAVLRKILNSPTASMEEKLEAQNEFTQRIVGHVARGFGVDEADDEAVVVAPRKRQPKSPAKKAA